MPNGTLLQDYTPKEKARILAEKRARVTAEDLLEYATDDSPLIPFDDLIQRMEARIREVETGRGSLGCPNTGASA